MLKTGRARRLSAVEPGHRPAVAIGIVLESSEGNGHVPLAEAQEASDREHRDRRAGGARGMTMSSISPIERSFAP